MQDASTPVILVHRQIFAAVLALSRAFVLGHVVIETGKAAERAVALRAVVCWLVEFVLVAEHGEGVTWGAVSIR